MKEKSGGRSHDDTNPDHGVGKRGGGFDYGRSARATSEAAGRFSGSRSDITVDIRQVERMRKAIVKADDRGTWRDGLVIAGAIVLALSQIATLVLASAINARANRIIAGDVARDRAGVETVQRLEGKLDEHVATTEELGRKLDALTTTTTTTTKPARKPVASPRTTTTTRRPTTTTPTTVRPSTTTTRPVTTTTIPTCSFALLNLCLIK